MKATKEQQTNSIAFLKKNLKPGAKVYTILRHVSSSGMSRSISTFIIRKKELIDITWQVSKALDRSIDKNRGGVKVSGCGMDMGFEIVYSLGRKLYPNGFKLPKGKYGRNGDTSGFDKDGGYSLKQEWA